MFQSSFLKNTSDWLILAVYICDMGKQQFHIPQPIMSAWQSLQNKTKKTIKLNQKREKKKKN